jgi:hypothetical protein
VAFTGAPLPAEVRTVQVSMLPGCTASLQRRQRWLLRGGFLPATYRRMMRMLHASPRAFRLKLQALLQPRDTPARSNKITR